MDDRCQECPICPDVRSCELAAAHRRRDELAYIDELIARGLVVDDREGEQLRLFP